jgi:predicted aspartyl protease
VSKAVSVMRYDNRIVAQGACVANPTLDVGTTVAQGSAPVPVYPTTASFSVPLVIKDAGFKTTVGLGSSFYNMTVDTGATSGLLRESIANALLAKGEATELEGGTSSTADGRRLQDRRISVYSVTLNGHTIHNVMFGVGPETASMLFGLLPLSQFGRFTIDPARQQLTFS